MQNNKKKSLLLKCWLKKEDIFNTNFVTYEILGKIAICNSNSLKGTIDCYNGRVNPKSKYFYQNSVGENVSGVVDWTLFDSGEKLFHFQTFGDETKSLSGRENADLKRIWKISVLDNFSNISTENLMSLEVICRKIIILLFFDILQYVYLLLSCH